METTKRLYRSETDKMIGGVCGGIAEYLVLDPSIVRILFVLLCFGGGSGLLLYVVLWFILPTKSSLGIIGEQTMKENAQDMENVARKVVKTVEEKIDSSKEKSNAKPAAKKTTRKTSTSKKKTSKK